MVDCTALPETLVESVLFGHENVTLTGDDKAYVGLAKDADGITLFLDMPAVVIKMQGNTCGSSNTN